MNGVCFFGGPVLPLCQVFGSQTGQALKEIYSHFEYQVLPHIQLNGMFLARGAQRLIDVWYIATEKGPFEDVVPVEN